MLKLLLFIVFIFLIINSIFSIKEGLNEDNKCAFCIPLHNKHFIYAYDLIKELSNEPVDLYFIFTTKIDKDHFFSNIKYGQNIKYLILSEFADIELIKKQNCFPAIKKLYALSVLYKNYDFISCVDSEIEFINKTNFYDVMKQISKQKIICGGDISTNKDSVKQYKYIIQDTLTNIVPLNDRDEMKRISKKYNIYTWWSNLPVYESKKIPIFLNWINFNNDSFIKKMNWSVFDDMLYNYFLILKYKYKLYIVPNLQHSLEYAPSKIIEYVDKNICKIYWVNKTAFLDNKKYYKHNNFYLIYHIDRK